MNDFRYRANRAVARYTDQAIEWAINNPTTARRYANNLYKFAISQTGAFIDRSLFNAGQKVGSFISQSDMAKTKIARRIGYGNHGSIYPPTPSRDRMSVDSRPGRSSVRKSSLEAAAYRKAFNKAANAAPVMQSQSGKVRPRSTNTVVHGKIGGRVPNTRIKEKDKFLKSGFTLTHESRGQVDDPNCVYVGHGLPLQQVGKGLIRLFVRDLMKKAGIDIIDWFHVVPINNIETYRISVQFYDTLSSAALNSFTSGEFGAITFEALVKLLFDAWDVAFTSSTNIPLFYKMLLTTTTGVGNSRIIGVIPFDNYKVEIKFKSNLTIQNATPAGAGTQAQGLDLLDSNIAVNPIKCKKYEVQNSNAFIQKSRGEAITSTWTGFVTNSIDGTFETTGTLLVAAQFQKPPAAAVFKNCATSNFNLEPGEIKDTKMSFRKKTSCQALVTVLVRYMVDNAQDKAFVPFGICGMVAAEHKLKNAIDANVTINYEHNYTMSFGSKYKNSKSTPIVIIVAADK